MDNYISNENKQSASDLKEYEFKYFSNIATDSITVPARTKNDTLNIVAGEGIVLTPNKENNSITITNSIVQNLGSAAYTDIEGYDKVGAAELVNMSLEAYKRVNEQALENVLNKLNDYKILIDKSIIELEKNKEDSVSSLYEGINYNLSAINKIINGTIMAGNTNELNGIASSEYLQKIEAVGYEDILTKTDAILTYELKGAEDRANLYTDESIANLINTSTITLNTLNEITNNLKDNADIIKALNSAIGAKVPITRTINGKSLSSDITITASDVGALPANTFIPISLADLSSDPKHRIITDVERATWNAKSNFSGNYNDLTNKPEILPGIQVDLLWENINNDIFSEQSIPISLIDYNLLLIIYGQFDKDNSCIKKQTSEIFPLSQIKDCDLTKSDIDFVTENFMFSTRTFNIINNKINFSDAKLCTFNAFDQMTFKIDNSFCIPIKIYGLKL